MIFRNFNKLYTSHSD